MQIQKNYKIIKHQRITHNQKQNSIKAINQFLSQENPSTLPTELNEISRIDSQSSIGRNFFINKRLQQGSESIFFQSKLTSMHSEMKSFIKNQQKYEENQINELKRQVQEQKTIIKLQDELISKLMAKLERNQSIIDSKQLENSAEDYFLVFEKLKKTRQLLQQFE